MTTQINGRGRVLIVDDEPNALKVLSAILSESKFDVVESQSVEKAIRIIRSEEIDTVITDLKMPGQDGRHLFDFMTENFSDIPIIFLTAYGTVESAVHAMTLGAFYYFIKPPDYMQLKTILTKAIEQRRLKRELQILRLRLSREGADNRIIGNNPEMLKVLDTIEAIKDSGSSVLICGDTGTGKELVACALHYESIRKDRPFIAVNCAAMPRELIESELFGYEKGAFTGAVSRRTGKLEEASDGTLFLDEIGEMPLSLQAKLLRVLEERVIERLGSNKKIPVKFRLISSTNRNLGKEVQTGNFREDLYYRLNVVQIKVPSLNERKDDIPLLVSVFVKEFCARENKVLKVSDKVMKIFQSFNWNGNVRQLRNVIESAVVLARGDIITPRELPDEFLSASKQTRNQPSVPMKTLKELELQAIHDILQECKGNKSEAARILGISRKSLYKRLSEN